MNDVKTLAILITPKTYQIAVTFLADGFATLPPVSVFNHVLVLNDIREKKIEGRGTIPVLADGWMTIDDFHLWYVTSGPLTDTEFTEAERIC